MRRLTTQEAIQFTNERVHSLEKELGEERVRWLLEPLTNLYRQQLHAAMRRNGRLYKKQVAALNQKNGIPV